MALPSGGSEQNFIATVAVVVDPDTLGQAGAQIKAALDKAVGSVSPVSLKGLAEGLTAFTKEQEKAILQAEKIKAAIEKTTAAEEKTAQAKAKTVEATARLSAAEERRQRAQDALQAKFDSSLQKLNQIYTVENQISTKNQEQLQAESALAEALARQNVLLNEQAGIQARLAAANPNITNPNFSIGNLLGTIGGNFQANVLSGQGIGGAASSALTQLQQSLYQVSLGGEKATAAFANLGIEGVGAVSGLTSGLAGVGAGLLTILPLALQFGQALGGAYEQQKELTFQSGLLAKQLGLTAKEGAQIRSLLTLVGQEDNIFASITLSQIQASIAALDQVEKGFQKANPQVEAFGKALKELGISYKTEGGDLKNFTQIVVELSAALEKLPASQRSLEVQRLAGLFGGDVAKLFGFGPDILTKNLESAVAVSESAQKQNDALKESAVELTNAQAQLNLTFFQGAGSVEQFANAVQTKALVGLNDFILFSRDLLGQPGGGSQDQGYLERRAETLKTRLEEARAIYGSILADPNAQSTYGRGGIEQARSQMERYASDLAEVNRQLEALRGKDKPLLDLGEATAKAEPDAKTLASRYKALEDALKDVQDAEKAVAKAQEDITKNNLEIAKSFDAQINALQKTADGYDKFYEKIGGLQAEIDKFQGKVGRPITIFGEGGKVTQDLALAIVNVRVLEERLAKLDAGKYPARAEKLQLQVDRARQALGLQPGEATTLENVDVRVGYTGLSAKDKKKLQEDIDALTELKKEFLAGGFDVTQSTFSLLSQALGDLSRPEYLKFLEGGASTLQNYAESLGLFSSPGFAQAIGESALQAKLLAGGFGEINTAAGASAAFEKYVDAFGDLRSSLFDFSKYIADPSLLSLDTIFKDFENYQKNPKKFQIPVAISLGLVTEADVALASQNVPTINVGSVADAVEEQAQAAAIQAAQAKLTSLGTGQGIVGAILAQYGVTPGEAIKASLDFTLDLKADNSLVEKQIKAQKKLAEELTKPKNLVAEWNLQVDLNTNISDLLEYLDDVEAALANNLPLPPQPTNNGGGGGGGGGGTPAEGYAAGGHVLRNIPFWGNEEGKGELYMAGRDGYILPGNDTANLLRGMGSRERLPQANITYAPVVQQTLNVDARGTNARDVTQAIQRTQAKQSLFTSSKPFLRDRDFLRAHGLR